MLRATVKISAVMLLCSAAANPAYAGNPGALPDLLPSNPEAGECYARVEIPAQYRSETQTVLTKDGHATLHVSEPELRSRQEQVLIREASVRYEVRQPTYRSEMDQILVRPSYERLQLTRPQFDTITETVGTSKPRLIWKKGNPARLRSQGFIVHSTADAGQGGRGYRSTSEYGRAQAEPSLCGATCEIWCLVEAPGQSVSYTRKVMTSPSKVHRVLVPAKYNTITRQVVADRGGVKEIPIPAKFQTITVEDVVKPATAYRADVAPKYSQIPEKILVSPERYEWRRVVCKTGTHPADTGRNVSQASYSSRHMSAPSRPIYQSTRSDHSGASAHSGVSHVPPNSHAASGSELRGSHSAESTGRTAYYGSDLPTYSEDYTEQTYRRRN